MILLFKKISWPQFVFVAELYTFLGCSALRIHSVQFVLYKSRVVATKRNEFLTFFYLCVVENDSWRKTKKDGVLEECV